MSAPRTESYFLQGYERLSLLQVEGRINNLRLNARQTTEIPRCTLDGRLKILLKQLQASIASQMAKIAEVPLAFSPPFRWIEECIRFQNFYSSLRHLPRMGHVIKVCIAIREIAMKKKDALAFQCLSPGDIKLQQKAILAEAWDQMGRIVFCAERAPQELEQVIAANQLNDILLYTEKKVANELKKIWGFLQLNSHVADAHGLQDAGKVFFAELPKEIAKILLTSQGQLNLGMIRPIKETLSSPDRTLSEIEDGILFILDRIDSSWQKAFDEIQLPQNSKLASNAMIRADLGLLSKEKITKLHCQQEVLGAVLSQFCNKQVGDCLAAAWALKRHNEFFLESIKDYASLIQRGCLTRIVNGNTDAFFFANTLADDSIFAVITTLERKGPVVEFKGAPFWKCPNLISACRLMGITDLEKRKDDLLQEASTLEVTNITWDRIIHSYARAKSGSKSSASLALGRYGFSLCNNRLLKAWETCLAASVDPYSGSPVRNNINKTVMKVFSNVFISSNHFKKTQIEEMKVNFKNTLNDSYRLVYNAAVPLPYFFTDGSFAFGGYELFQRDSKDFTNKGIRIATPEQFKTFIMGVINTCSTPEKGKIVIESVIDALQICALQNDFMKQVICAYDRQNKKEKDPVSDYEYLDQTPMLSLCNDYCSPLITIDRANNFNPDIRAIPSDNPGEQLKWVLHLAKWKTSTDLHLKGVSEEEIFFPDLLIDGPQLQHFLFSKISVEEWIKNTLIDPGLSVSRAEVGIGLKLRLQKKIKTWLSEQINNTPRNVKAIDLFFTKLNPKLVTVQQFAQRSYIGLLSIFSHETDLIRSITLMMDSFLLESLLEEKLCTIHQSAVRFARINDSQEKNKLSLCCFFNPRTELIDIGSIHQDKLDLRPMGHYEWSEVWKDHSSS